MCSRAPVTWLGCFDLFLFRLLIFLQLAGLQFFWFLFDSSSVCELRPAWILKWRKSHQFKVSPITRNLEFLHQTYKKPSIGFQPLPLHTGSCIHLPLSPSSSQNPSPQPSLLQHNHSVSKMKTPNTAGTPSGRALRTVLLPPPRSQKPLPLLNPSRERVWIRWENFQRPSRHPCKHWDLFLVGDCGLLISTFVETPKPRRTDGRSVPPSKEV